MRRGNVDHRRRIADEPVHRVLLWREHELPAAVEAGGVGGAAVGLPRGGGPVLVQPKRLGDRVRGGVEVVVVEEDLSAPKIRINSCVSNF